jgi:hypothetical protein
VILGRPSGGRGHAPYGARRGKPRPYKAPRRVCLRPKAALRYLLLCLMAELVKLCATLLEKTCHN